MLELETKNLYETILEFYTYDELGLLRELVSENKSGTTEKTLYNYNLKKHLTDIITYDSNGELINKTLILNDFNGNVIESNRYDEDGITLETEKFKYDNAGNIIEKFIYVHTPATTYPRRTEASSYLNTYHYLYDKEGNLISEANDFEKTLSLNTDSHLLEWTDYKYDVNGNLLEGSNKYYKLTYKYDSQNNIIEELTYNNKIGELIDAKKYAYEFYP